MILMSGPDGVTAVGVIGPDAAENRAFLSFSRSFKSIDLPVPQIYGEGDGAYLLEDLGDTTLFAALQRERAGAAAFPDSMIPVYRRVLETLPRFQVEGGRVVDYRVGYPRAAFDRQSMHWDLNYFKYHFLKLAHIPFDEERLERDFEQLIAFLQGADTSHFLYRDFQSRNVMLRDGAPWFIDYQGGRRGALQYDVASLLYDGKAAIPKSVRASLLKHYLDAVQDHLPVDREAFRRHYIGYVLIRLMQAMGAYGYRGFYERKAHFLQSVPHAVRNLEHLLTERRIPIELPELTAVFERICASERLRRDVGPKAEGLTVRISSFSYKNGYPVDDSGHGGGYVFDCRAVENPGRQEKYKGLTGRDDAVIAFLEAEPSCEAFFAHALGLVKAQVESYRARAFDSLSVNFGCTGGQHRSVYFAERLAGALEATFDDVNVTVTHAQAGSWPRAASVSAGGDDRA